MTADRELRGQVRGRLSLVQRVTLAYLRSALDPQDTRWSDMLDAVTRIPDPPARIDTK